METSELQTGNLFDVCYQTYNETGFWVSGWGKTDPSDDGSGADILQEVELPFVDPALCKKMLRENVGIKNPMISDAMLCAGGQEGKDSCRGDSGGPLVRRLSSNQWVLTGIVSYGYNCGGRDIPAIYTKVSSIAGWIYDVSNAQIFSDVRINGDVFRPETQSDLNWDPKLGWRDATCLGRSDKVARNPRIFSFSKMTTRNRRNRPMTVKPNKRRFLPPEGSDNFELEFEVKTMKNAIINVCKKEKSDKKCMQFNLGALESGNYASYVNIRNENDGSSVELKNQLTPFILDEKNYNAFKLVYEEGFFRLYNTNDKIRNALNRQHRDESDFLTDELFDIVYNRKPLLEVENSPKRMNGIVLKNINHVEFATEDAIGYWNLQEVEDKSKQL